MSPKLGEFHYSTPLPTLTLASASPRRAELISKLQIPFAVEAPNIDEDGLEHLPPHVIATQLAQKKAKAVWAEGKWVLSADTVVAINDSTLAKPQSIEENVLFLRALSGQSHTVFTGFTILGPTGVEQTHVDESRVYFRDLPNHTIHQYANTGEGLDKAGGYGAQGLGMILIERIEGDFYNVMGLPVRRVWATLEAMGFFAIPQKNY